MDRVVVHYSQQRDTEAEGDAMDASQTVRELRTSRPARRWSGNDAQAYEDDRTIAEIEKQNDHACGNDREPPGSASIIC